MVESIYTLYVKLIIIAPHFQKHQDVFKQKNCKVNCSLVTLTGLMSNHFLSDLKLLAMLPT
jgi:hypothetical protein